MPDPHRLGRELRDVLSKPCYSSLLFKQGQARQKPVTAASLADEAVQRIMRDSPFEGEVTIEELKGGRNTELYRAFDGIDRAMTLGAFWCDRLLIESIWSATAKSSNGARRSAFFELLRSAMFVRMEWNRMIEIACMSLSAGNSVPVVKGKGSWRALRTQPGRKPLTPDIRTQRDVMDSLGWMPIPGPHQYFVPLFNDMWVSKVPSLRHSWPLAS
jgi:hypothetical protein